MLIASMDARIIHISSNPLFLVIDMQSTIYIPPIQSGSDSGNVLILDIDDTLTFPSPYRQVPDQETRTPEFEKRLANAPVAPWVANNRELLQASQVFYITGRPHEFSFVTEKWLRQHAFPQWTRGIVYLDFGAHLNYARYVADKLDRIRQFSSGKRDVTVIEDSRDIVNQVRAQFPDIHVIKITNGSLSRGT